MKTTLRRMFRLAGLEVRRTAAQRDPFEAQQQLLRAIPKPMIFDVGAHRGETAKRYAELFPDAQIHSFEPFPDSFAAVEEIARAEPRIHAHRAAVADAPGTRTFYVNGLAATNSLLPRPSDSRRYFPERGQTVQHIEVDVTTLDGFCARHAISRIDALKLDIQGGERAALAGARELLSRHAIGVIFTEVMFVPHYEGGALFHELTAQLAGHGYSLYDLFIARHGTNGQLRYGDAIFVSPQVRSEVLDAAPAEP